MDPGLMCHLLGLRRAGDLRTHPLRGAIFETFVVSELRKLFLHHGERPPLYFWRDSNGREVDVLIDYGSHRLPLEIKAGETLGSDAVKGLGHYAGLAGDPRGVVVYGGAESYSRGPYRVRSWRRCS